MRLWQVIVVSLMAAIMAHPTAAQTPVLGNVEAPYPALQSAAHIAGKAYGPGAVTYGPAGTPLVLSGSNFGVTGTVQFTSWATISGTLTQGTTVSGSPTMWTSNLVFVPIPTGATSGLITVMVEGKVSNALPLIVTPGTYSASCSIFPAGTQLQITTSSLHDGTASQAYNASLGATGGTSPYSWTLTTGSLPAGLNLSSAGTISGTPASAAGPVDLTVQVTDSSSPPKADQAVLSLNIESQVLTAQQVYSYSSSYDGVGNVTSYNDSVMGNWGSTSNPIVYDTLNRLVSSTPTSGDFYGQYGCWTYDSFGNRTSESLSATPCTNGPPMVTSATYNVSNTNRMDATNQNPNQGTNGYDAAGDVTFDGVNTYVYDAEGRLCAVKSEPVPGTYTMTGYIYNAEGERVAKGTVTTLSCDPTSNGFTLTESYVLGLGGEELTMLGGSGSSPWQRTNVYGQGKLLATYDLNPYGVAVGSPTVFAAMHFHLTDPLGTRRMQTSSVGQPELDCQSLPFGDELNCFIDGSAPATADDGNPLHFTGKERDAESGNDYFEARYYSSAMGRFMSPDWAAKEQPVPYATFDDPQSLNLYSYVRNNPLTRADADGHCPDACVVEGGSAVVVGAAIVLTGVAVGAAHYFSTDSGQRSFSTFTSAAGDSIHTNVQKVENAVTGLFSKSSGDKPSTLAPGPHAGEGTPARSGDRDFTPGERGAVNAEGAEKGCHTCGTTDPGTKSGNFVPDHQPPTALNPAGGAQTLYPQCLSCSRTQGGEVNAAKQQTPPPTQKPPQSQ
jgi:RHS repeat-associated protein